MFKWDINSRACIAYLGELSGRPGRGRAVVEGMKYTRATLQTQYEIIYVGWTLLTGTNDKTTKTAMNGDPYL
jgi:hypothetical protein